MQVLRAMTKAWRHETRQCLAARRYTQSPVRVSAQWRLFFGFAPKETIGPEEMGYPRKETKP